MAPKTRTPPTISKVGQAELGNRGVAAAAAPNPGQGTNRIQISTYFTKTPVVGEPPQILYQSDRLWALVTLTLETAGPVAVGQMTGLTPVLSGKGQLLETGTSLQFKVAKGDKLYVAATGVNRIKLTVESVPWLEQITGLIMQMTGGLLNKIVGA